MERILDIAVGFAHSIPVCLVLLYLGPEPVYPQTTTGTILGAVSDSSGSVVPGATVTATHVDTGLTRTTVTAALGRYTPPTMTFGRYTVKGELRGFKTAVSGPFELVVDQKLRSDFVLAIGEMSETVQVEGVGATLLQTDQSDVNQIVQEKEIKGLPLNGRDFFSLLLLSDGVQDTSNDQGRELTNVSISIYGMWRVTSYRILGDGAVWTIIK